MQRGPLNSHITSLHERIKDMLIWRENSLTWWGDPVNRQTHSGLCSQLKEREKEWVIRKILSGELKQVTEGLSDEKNKQYHSCEPFRCHKFPKESTRWSQWSLCLVPVERYCMSSQHTDALNQCRSLLITSSTWSPSEEIRAYLLKRSNPARRVCVCVSPAHCRKWNFLNETLDRGVVPPVWSG